MRVTITTFNGLRPEGDVEVSQGHLDPGYIQVAISAYGGDGSQASIVLDDDDAEALAANINLAVKHSRISKREA